MEIPKKLQYCIKFNWTYSDEYAVHLLLFVNHWTRTESLTIDCLLVRLCLLVVTLRKVYSGWSRNPWERERLTAHHSLKKNNGKLLKRKIYSDKYFLEIFFFLLTLSKKKNPGTRTQAFIIIVKNKKNDRTKQGIPHVTNPSLTQCTGELCLPSGKSGTWGRGGYVSAKRERVCVSVCMCVGSVAFLKSISRLLCGKDRVCVSVCSMETSSFSVFVWPLQQTLN